MRDMHILLRVYLVVGVAFLLSVYVITLSLWFDAPHGTLNGQYLVAIDTNALGENDIVSVLFFAFLPLVTWLFTSGLRRVLSRRRPCSWSRGG